MLYSVVDNLLCHATRTKDFSTITCSGIFRDEFKWRPYFQCTPVALHETVYLNASENGLLRVITTLKISIHQMTLETLYTCSIKLIETGIEDKDNKHAQNIPKLDWSVSLNSK